MSGMCPFALGSCVSLAPVISGQHDSHKQSPSFMHCCQYCCCYYYCFLSQCLFSRKFLCQSVISAFCSFLIGEEWGERKRLLELNFQLARNHKQSLWWLRNWSISAVRKDWDCSVWSRKGSGGSCQCAEIPEGRMQRRQGPALSNGSEVTRQEAVATNWKTGEFLWTSKHCHLRVMQYCYKLPNDMMMSPATEMFKSSLDTAMGSWL